MPDYPALTEFRSLKNGQAFYTGKRICVKAPLRDITEEGYFDIEDGSSGPICALIDPNKPLMEQIRLVTLLPMFDDPPPNILALYDH